MKLNDIHTKVHIHTKADNHMEQHHNYTHKGRRSIEGHHRMGVGVKDTQVSRRTTSLNERSVS